MEREMTEVELQEIKAGVNLDISSSPSTQVDELTEEQLRGIFGGIPQGALEDKVMESTELFRDKALMDYVDKKIKEEELSGGDSSVSKTGGMSM